MKTFTRNGLTAAFLITTMAATFGASAEENGPELPGTSVTAQSAEASLMWRGMVEYNVSSTDMILTGANAATNISNGLLNNVKSDATFTSTQVVVEAHKNTADDAANPVVGDLMGAKEVNWTITAPDVYANTDEDISGIIKTMKFSVGGAQQDINTSFTDDTNILSVSVANDIGIAGKIAANTSVQVSAVILASKAI